MQKNNSTPEERMDAIKRNGWNIKFIDNRNLLFVNSLKNDI